MKQEGRLYGNTTCVENGLDTTFSLWENLKFSSMVLVDVEVAKEIS